MSARASAAWHRALPSWHSPSRPLCRGRRNGVLRGVSAQFVAGKATRDALFLANIDVTTLPRCGGGGGGRVELASSSSLLRPPPDDARGAHAGGVRCQRASDALDWLFIDGFARPVAGRLSQVVRLGPLLGSGFC